MMVQKLKGDVTKAAQQEANARALAEKANEGKVKAAAKVKLAQTGERSAKLALEREKKKLKAGTPSKRKAPLPSQPGPGNANQSAEAEGLAKQVNQDAGLLKGALKQSEKNATEWMKMALYQQRSEQSRAYSKEVLLPMVNASPNSAAKLIPAVAAALSRISGDAQVADVGTTEGKYPLPFLVRSVGAKALFGMLLFSESCPYCRSGPWRVSR
jgi:hypothetical protein